MNSILRISFLSVKDALKRNAYFFKSSRKWFGNWSLRMIQLDEEKIVLYKRILKEKEKDKMMVRLEKLINK